MKSYNVYTVTKTGFFCGHCDTPLTEEEAKKEACPQCGSHVGYKAIPKNKWPKKEENHE